MKTRTLALGYLQQRGRAGLGHRRGDELESAVRQFDRPGQATEAEVTGVDTDEAAADAASIGKQVLADRAAAGGGVADARAVEAQHRAAALRMQREGRGIGRERQRCQRARPVEDAVQPERRAAEQQFVAIGGHAQRIPVGCIAPQRRRPQARPAQRGASGDAPGISSKQAASSEQLAGGSKCRGSGVCNGTGLEWFMVDPRVGALPSAATRWGRPSLPRW